MKGKKAIQSKFPTARIKKIMQEDEDVGKVAQSTPLVISKALELFIRDIVTESCEIARSGGSKKLMPYHVKRLGQQNRQYDFLDPLLLPISDPLGANAPTTALPKKERVKAGGQPSASGSLSGGAGSGASGGSSGQAQGVKKESKPEVKPASVGNGSGAISGRQAAPSSGPAGGAVRSEDEDDYDEDEDSDESD